jgi:chaperonin GroES
MKFTPLYDRVVIKRIDEEERTQGGIVIPDAAREQQDVGIVMAVGCGRVLDNGKLLAPRVKVGERVLFQKYSGHDVKIEGADYVVFPEGDLLGIEG